MRQRRNTVPTNVARVRPQPVGKRRQTLVAVATQVVSRNLQVIPQRRESVATQIDSRDLETVPQRRLLAPQNPTIWCICRTVERGDMIFCENPHCLIKWFHFDCMAIATAPEGDWFCPNCALMNERL